MQLSAYVYSGTLIHIIEDSFDKDGNYKTDKTNNTKPKQGRRNPHSGEMKVFFPTFGSRQYFYHLGLKQWCYNKADWEFCGKWKWGRENRCPILASPMGQESKLILSPKQTHTKMNTHTHTSAVHTCIKQFENTRRSNLANQITVQTFFWPNGSRLRCVTDQSDQSGANQYRFYYWSVGVCGFVLK